MMVSPAADARRRPAADCTAFAGGGPPTSAATRISRHQFPSETAGFDIRVKHGPRPGLSASPHPGVSPLGVCDERRLPPGFDRSDGTSAGFGNGLPFRRKPPRSISRRRKPRAFVATDQENAGRSPLTEDPQTRPGFAHALSWLKNAEML